MIKAKDITYIGLGNMEWVSHNNSVMLYIEGQYSAWGHHNARLRVEHDNVVLRVSLCKYPVMSRCVMFQREGGFYNC